ncbi:MAB_1171c family putative transporter [Streptomyces sp. 8N706]|uniref:MAB_1171c family putative transporter n=1 Tax=Streptomyces sp. 8N706 TaxID=3457416 RepID=UPI003FD6A37F
MTLRLILVAGLLDLGVLWKVYQLCRAPRDRVLLAVTLCMAFVAASFSLGLRAEARAVDALLGLGAARLIANALLLGAVYWLLCFYLYSAADRRRANRRALLEAVLLAVVVAVLTWATVATPSSVRGRAHATADMSVTPVAVFFTAAGLYLVYAFAATLRWTWRYAGISERPLSTGLRLTAVSLAGMVVANAIRVLSNVVQWGGGDFPEGLRKGAAALLALAIPLFVVGVSYSGVATRLAGLRIWWQHRRAYQALRPLWTALHDAFPEDALNRSPTTRWRELLHIRAMHRRYYRRVIECRDGLVRLSPHLARLGVREESPPESVAEILPSALQAQASGVAADSPAFGVALPSEDSLDADARQLVAVSQALEARR